MEKMMYKEYGISQETFDLVNKCENELQEEFKK